MHLPSIYRLSFRSRFLRLALTTAACYGCVATATAADLSSKMRSSKIEKRSDTEGLATPAMETTGTNPNTSVSAQNGIQGRELELADLDELLASAGDRLDLHLSFGKDDALSDLEFAQASILAQAIALRTTKGVLRVTYGADPAPVYANIVLGTYDELQTFVPELDANKSSPCMLAIRRSPGSNEGFMLIVAGKTPEDLTAAVMSLALVRTALPRIGTTFIKEVIMPELPEFSRQPPLESGKKYSFGELVKRGMPLRALSDGGVGLTLFYPPYIGLKDTGSGSLVIRFQAKGGPLRGKDKLKVVINGTTLTATDRRQGAGFEEVRVSLPLATFVAGANPLEITLDRSTPSATAEEVLIYGTSTLEMPIFQAPAPAVDLGLTSRTLYPLIGRPDGGEIAVTLYDNNRQTNQSALTLLAKLAQSSQTVLYAADYSYGAPVNDRHIIAFGPFATLPEELQERIPMRSLVPELDKAKNARELYAPKNLKWWIDRQMPKWRPIVAAKAEPTQASPTSTTPYQEYGYLSAVNQVKSPNRWTLVMTAFTPELLETRTNQITLSDKWKQIGGDIVRLADGSSPLEIHTPSQISETVISNQQVEMALGDTWTVKEWGWATGIALVLIIYLTAKLVDRRIRLISR